VGLNGGGVPGVGGLGDVVVLFVIVSGVVTGGAEIVGVEFFTGGQRHHGTHVDATAALAIEAAGDGGAGGRTDRMVGPRFLEEHAFGGEGIDVGRAGVGVAVATHLGAVVFTGEPKDIGTVGGGGGRGGESRSEGARAERGQNKIT
jgi:hypothetical protein